MLGNFDPETETCSFTHLELKGINHSVSLFVNQTSLTVASEAPALVNLFTLPQLVPISETINHFFKST